MIEATFCRLDLEIPLPRSHVWLYTESGWVQGDCSWHRGKGATSKDEKQVVNWGGGPFPSRWCQQEVGHREQCQHHSWRKSQVWGRPCFITGTNLLFNGWLVRKPIVWSLAWIFMWECWNQSVMTPFLMSVISYRMCICQSVPTPSGRGRVQCLTDCKSDVMITLSWGTFSSVLCVCVLLSLVNYVCR